MDGLRNADELLLPQVQHTITQLDLTPADSAAATLAEQYARAIDTDPDQLDALGPKLLAALVELGATPRARAAITKGGGEPDRGPNRIKALREARRA